MRFRGFVQLTCLLVSLITAAWAGPKSLQEAARDGDLENARQILARGADVNATDAEGQSALHHAAARGDDTVVQLLLSHHANVNVRSGGVTPLFMAIWAGHTSTMKLLVDAGGDINAGTPTYETPLSAAIKRGPTSEAALFLIQHGADVNPPNPYGMSPLYDAVVYKRGDVASLLLDRGADVNARTKDGDTSLRWAAYIAQGELVELLIQHGADVNARNSRYETPLNRAAEGGGAGDFVRVASMLLDHGADIEAADTRGRTALHAAAFSQREDVVAVLLRHGARVKAVESRGQTPLHVAAERGNKPIGALLLDNGADVNGRDSEGNTPLHEATAHLGDLSVIKLLLERGANPLLKAKNGNTPLNTALYHQNHEAAVLLREEQLAALNRQGVAPATRTPPIDTDRMFKGAMFADAKRGYVFGTGYLQGESSIIATKDGGATWRLVMDFPHYRPADDRVPDVDRQKDDIWTVAFLDLEHFWVRTLRGQIHHTTNGGRTFDVFTPDLVDPFTGARITSWVDASMQFVSNTVGYAVCAANVQKTTDGGKTWVARPVPRALGAVTQVWFFDELIGIATTGRGFQGIVRTTDGGRSWAGVPNAPSFDKLSCTREAFCAGLGLRRNGGSFVLFSTDRGLTWQDTHLKLIAGDADWDSERINDLQAVAPKLVALVGQLTDGNQLKGLLIVWDGFKWTRRTYAPPYELSGVYFLDAVHGWFTARDSKHRLYQTTDGGNTLTYVADYFHHIEAQTPGPTPRSNMSTSVRDSYEPQP